MTLLVAAIRLASSAHSGQLRKYTEEPYITHPLRVMAKVCGECMTELDAAAAVCHDVLEDCTEYYSEKMKDLDFNLWLYVRELTNPSKQHQNLARQVRKQMDRDHLETITDSAKIIKCLDRIDNLRDMSQAPDDFKRIYTAESRLLADALLKYQPSMKLEHIVLTLREVIEVVAPPF